MPGPMISTLLCIAIVAFFIGNIVHFKVKRNFQNVLKSWPKHRCNPIYMLFAKDIEQNFYSCMQTGVKNFVPHFLAPLHTLIDKLSGLASHHSTSINSMRISHFNLKGMLGNTFKSMISVFEMMGVEFLKSIFTVQDLVHKFIGIGVSMMYIIESTVDSFGSVWNGPPGQILNKLSSINLCFHQKTIVTLIDKTEKYMMDLKRGDILVNGSIVLKTLHLYNYLQTPFYKLDNI